MFDCVVIGGGIVGALIADCLPTHLDSVLMYSGQDSYPRAAQANFELLWYQSKGAGMPVYQRLSRLGSEEWRSFFKEIDETSGIPIEVCGGQFRLHLKTGIVCAAYYARRLVMRISGYGS